MIRLSLLIFAGLFAAVSLAESNSKGSNSPIVVGVLKSASGSDVTVLQNGGITRELKLTGKSDVSFVGMPSEADHKMAAGYGVKAKVGKDGTIKSLLLTKPVGEIKPLGKERRKMTEQQLFAVSDADGDSAVSYVEFSRTIHYSPKHGPDGFKKADKNSDGTLNQKEFAKLLSGVTWWVLSRKTPEEWFAAADKDGSGDVSKEEFKLICTSGNHLDNVFKKTDRDKSATLDLKELARYVGYSD